MELFRPVIVGFIRDRTKIMMIKLIITVLCIAAIIFAASLAPYIFTFGHKRIVDDPLMWGAFGTYFNGTVGPLISLVNVGVVLYIARIATRIGQDRQNAYELHREWNSTEMFKNRTLGGILISKPNAPTLDVLEKEGDPNENMRVWIVIAFYQRLWFAIEHHQIDENLVTSLFGDIFYWWYKTCFLPQLKPTPWESWDHIEGLWTWLKAHDDDGKHRKRWEGRWGPLPATPPTSTHAGPEMAPVPEAPAGNQ